jgi:curved DNA-binding protein CbpA
VPAESPERTARTKKFQQINDAYYTLSDPARRRDYDATRAFNSGGGFGGFDDADADADEEVPSTGGFQGWGDFFKNTFGSNTPDQERARANTQFSSVFEEMMREEGMAEGERAQPTGKFWSLVGGLSGGAMGFIIANFPGAVAGAVAGNRLGAVRDSRGKSVYAVFQELPQADKAALLSNLAAKVFAHAVGSG